MASIVSITIMFLMACRWSPSALAVSLVLATDDSPGSPWIMGGGSHFEEKSPGLEIEPYRLMAKGLDLELKMVRLPWKRCLIDLMHGRVNGVFPASFKPERLSLGHFPTKNGDIDPSSKERWTPTFGQPGGANKLSADRD